MERDESSALLTPVSAVVAMIAFEGPDRYSQAGGLGVRVSGLSQSLADEGFQTHLYFIGDPSLPPEEVSGQGRLRLHRWGQWISANCLKGVYDGEVGKMNDLTDSLPRYLLDQVVVPALESDRVPVLLFEEWQTAECASRVADQLVAMGLRDRVLIVWNANHCYGFDRIDWRRVAASTMVTTVSRHMRTIIRSCGADAIVIPNGIPSAALKPVDRREVAAVRSAVASRPAAGLFFKMARWEREKGWSQALDAVAGVRDDSRPLLLVARGGGPSGPGGELAEEATRRNLSVVSFDTEQRFKDGLADSVTTGADVVNLRFGVSPSLARTMYAASDGVLANSVAEPFGLVGLEAMAAGGVAYTGGTGEDYAVPGKNAVVLQTLDHQEIVARWRELAQAPAAVARIRREAKKTARDYEWTSIVSGIMSVLDRQARRQGIV
jgi:glycosyltransferase involved in cell wall biosynthesis